MTRETIEQRTKEFWFIENEQGAPPKILDYIPGAGLFIRLARDLSKDKNINLFSPFYFLQLSSPALLLETLKAFYN